MADKIVTAGPGSNPWVSTATYGNDNPLFKYFPNSKTSISVRMLYITVTLLPLVDHMKMLYKN